MSAGQTASGHGSPGGADPPAAGALSQGWLCSPVQGRGLRHLYSLRGFLFFLIYQKTSDDTWCPALSLPPGPTHSVRPPITINLANFLGHTIPRDPHFGGQQRNKTPCCFPSLLITRGTSFFGLTSGGEPRASLAALHETMRTCSGEFPPRLIRAGKKRAFLLVVKGGLRC